MLKKILKRTLLSSLYYYPNDQVLKIPQNKKDLENELFILNKLKGAPKIINYEPTPDGLIMPYIIDLDINQFSVEYLYNEGIEILKVLENIELSI